MLQEWWEGKLILEINVCLLQNLEIILSLKNYSPPPVTHHFFLCLVCVCVCVYSLHSFSHTRIHLSLMLPAVLLAPTDYPLTHPSTAPHRPTPPPHQESFRICSHGSSIECLEITSSQSRETMFLLYPHPSTLSPSLPSPPSPPSPKITCFLKKTG